ncbi:MAG: hypothetical protein IJZ72_01545 [Oscillospiraceae bacterium]|nr:hypothetical protein [Oscillospiraceae bacterium]
MNIDLKRKKEKRNIALRWVLYYVIMAVEYVIMTTVRTELPAPLLILATAMSISVFEDPFDAAVLGCTAGFLIDSAEGTLMGMNGIIIMWCCLMSSLLFYFVMRRHIVNVLLIVSASTVLQTGFRYIFYYFIWGYDNSGAIFLERFLPVVVTTVISVLPIYPLIRLMHSRLGLIKETYIEEKSDDIVRE